jgi:AraC-like DNA-binding protein
MPFDYTYMLLYVTFVAVSMFLSSIFIVALRGFKRPTMFIVLERLAIALMLVLNIFQTYNTPHFGAVLLNPLHLFFPLLTYPFVFAYMFSLMQPQSINRRFWLITYSPFVILTGLYLLIRQIRGALPVITSWEQLHDSLGEPEIWVRFAAVFVFTVVVAVFARLAFRMLKRHKENLQSDFSYTEGATLGWIRWSIALVLFRAVFAVLMVLFEGRAVKYMTCMICLVEPVIITIWVLQQKDLYKQPVRRRRQREEDISADENLETEQPLEKWGQLKQNLLDLLEKDEIFKDPELNGEKVREMLNTNRTYLSHIINQDMNTTFYNLINSYRLNKSLEMMRDSSHRNIPLKNIAEICGFKNLSSFCTMFKQTYGKTPTEWKEEQGQNGGKAE